MVAAIIGASATVLVAIITYALTYVSNRRLRLWQERLARTNAQLKDFYGPLFALSQSGQRTWRLLLSKTYGRSREEIAQAENGDLWVLWVTEVFQPINEKMASIIVEHADLLIDNKMPECLLNLCAHAAGYGAVIKRWQEGNRTEMFSIVDWPKDLNEYLETSFGTLKAEQQRLIGLINKTSRWNHVTRDVHQAFARLTRTFHGHSLVARPTGGNAGEDGGEEHDDQGRLGLDHRAISGPLTRVTRGLSRLTGQVVTRA